MRMKRKGLRNYKMEMQMRVGDVPMGIMNEKTEEGQTGKDTKINGPVDMDGRQKVERVKAKEDGDEE